MDMLQKVADRELAEVTIEIDDLDNVRIGRYDSWEGMLIPLFAV